MRDIEILGQLLKSSALLSLEQEHGKSLVKLQEPQTKDCCVSIRNLPADALVIKVDAFSSPDKIFKGKNGECCRADYVIVSEEKRCIIHIELKRKKDKLQQIINQLQGSFCFMQYCREIGRLFWKKDKFLSDYRNRFVSVGHIGIAKRKTRIAASEGCHDLPERAMKIDWPHYIQFNILAK
ncbi:MAG: hypothetical protein PHG44_04370 [Lentisphaeria bacterium]|mgnify:CR=1 FL=1|jgi:hypothetical protein|nr:hypothetical protein [Lentisphaeria bacterium]MDY0176559.1 hypothetical protein [Lentisphaeria bacterium]NLZ59703.1 hypothetical protein [Lentisphaerota bacterium]